MAGGVPIIDLDSAAPSADSEAHPFRLRLRPPRPVLALAVVLLVLATLGAATTPARWLTHVMSAGGTAAAAFVLGTDSLYTASFGNNPNSESGVRGFRLSDGSLRWAAALPQNVQNLVVDDSVHVLMARSAIDPKVSFLDTGTGEVLWRNEEVNTSIVAMVRGTVLSRTDIAATQSTLRLVDARTGGEIWKRVVDATASLQDMSGGDWTRLVTVGTAGAVTVLNHADGQVLAEGDTHLQLPVQLDNPDGRDYAGVTAIGDRLYISKREGGAGSLSAYSLVPFALVWHTGDSAAGRITDCGIVVCLQDGTGLTVVDPATGAVRWTSPEVRSAFRYDATTLSTYDQKDPAGAMLRDAATGRTERDFGPSVNVDGVVLRYDQTSVGRIWVLVDDAADGGWHIVGSLEIAAPFGCEVRNGYLACPTTAGPTMVWKLP